jgi:hypothetical protein
MKSLFEIGNEYLEIYHLLEDNGGEITPEIETALAINKSNLQEKSQNYISLIKEIEGRSRTVEIEIKRLQALKKRNDTFVLKLKENIANAMRMLEIDEIRTDLNKINFRKSKSVQIEDIEMLPNDCVIIEKKPISKTELKKRIENGEVINGVSIIENLNLQIK